MKQVCVVRDFPFGAEEEMPSLSFMFLGQKGGQQLVLSMLCRQVGPYRFHKDLAGGPVPWTTTDEADDQSQEAHG